MSAAPYSSMLLDTCLSWICRPTSPFTILGTSHVTAEESNHPQPGLASAPARSAHAGGPEGSADSLATAWDASDWRTTTRIQGEVSLLFCWWYH